MINVYDNTIEKLQTEFNADVEFGPWGYSADKDVSKTITFPFRDGEILLWCVDRIMPNGREQYIAGWYKTPPNTQKSLRVDTDEFVQHAAEQSFWDRRVDSCTHCDKHVFYDDLQYVLFAGRECDSCFNREKNNIPLD